MIASHIVSSQINKINARWNIDTGCFDHKCNNRLYFSIFKLVYQPITIQSVGEVLFAIGIGNVLLIVESKNEKKSEVLLLGVLHIPGLFTNLIFGSKLLKKGYYLYSDNQTVNSCSDNIEIASCFI